MEAQADHVVEFKVREGLGHVTVLGGDPHTPLHVLPRISVTHTHTHSNLLMGFTLVTHSKCGNFGKYPYKITHIPLVVMTETS